MRRLTEDRRALAVLALALVLAALSVWQLERQRSGIDIVRFAVGQTPVTSYMRPGAEGPVVVISHGFAGSSQMMQSYALTLAQAGYRTYAFDYLGHGRNPLPMSGDIGSVDGATRRLVDQTLAVMASVANDTEPPALIGHSMATDVIIRVAKEAEVGPVVGLSTFSQAVTRESPRDLLLISGQAEGRFRTFAVEAVRQLDPDGREGEIFTRGGQRRAAMVAPLSDHVSILRNRAAQRAALDWLNGYYGRDGGAQIPRAGWWLLGLLGAVVALYYPISRLLDPAGEALRRLHGWRFALVVVAPAVVAPLAALTVGTGFMDLLVADYLALHLLVYGVVQLALAWALGMRFGRLMPAGMALLVFWGIGVFGFALDRYGANFLPVGSRWWIIALLCLGTVPFMLADALVTGGGRGPLWQRLAVRVMFLLSMGLAMALDFEGLFFLVMIAPVVVLFYIIFGLMGRWTAQRSGALAAGLGQGAILAWAIGVSFPLFVSLG